MPRTRGDCVAARGAALGSNYSSAIARYGREHTTVHPTGAPRGRAAVSRRVYEHELTKRAGRECGVGAATWYFGAVAGVAGRVPPGGGCDEDDRVKFIVKCAVSFAILHTDVRRGCKIYILHVKFTFYKM